MARTKHKTAHRKALEANQKRRSALRDKFVAELAAGVTLKANAASNAEKLAKASRRPEKAPAPAPAKK